MPDARTPGKYGRRAPDKSRPAVRLRDVLTGTLPDVPAGADYLAALDGGWNMLGNDSFGDCCSVTWANIRRLVTTTLTPLAATYPDLAQVIAFYRTQNPGFDPAGDPAENGPGSPADGGMDIKAALGRLVSHGGPDGVRAVAYLSIDPADADEVRAALAVFGFLWTGVIVTQANERQFAAGEPWDADPESPQAGGHSIVTGGYGGSAGASRALSGDEKFITWAAETSFTDAFWASQCDELWAVIWPEHLGSKEFLAGINLEALDSAWQALGGTPLAIPGQPRKPGTGHQPALESLIERVRVMAAHDLGALERFLDGHGF